MKTMYENLREYLDNTSSEQVKKDWEETKGYGNIDGPTIEEFMKHIKNK